jgi:hypothetical protein
MTDAPFVVGAYAIVLMGLVGYAVTLRRRLSGARRIVAAVEDERGRDRPAVEATPDGRGPDSTEVLP